MTSTIYPKGIDGSAFAVAPVPTMGIPASVPQAISDLRSATIALEIGVGNNIRSRGSVVTAVGSTSTVPVVFEVPVSLVYGQAGQFYVRVIGTCTAAGTGSGAMIVGDTFNKAFTVAPKNVSGTTSAISVTETGMTANDTSMASCTAAAVVTSGTIVINITPVGVGSSTTGAISWSSSIEGLIDYAPAPGMAAWYRADSLSSSPVASWVDLSGNGNTMLQSTSGSKPTWSATAGPNGLPCVNFSGSEFMQVASAITGLSFTIFVVQKTSNASALQSLVQVGTNPNPLAGYSVATYLDQRVSFVWGQGDIADTVTPVSTGWEEWMISQDGSGGPSSNGPCQINFNGNVDFSGTGLVTAGQGAATTIGQYYSGTFGFTGSIYEIIMYNSVLNAGQIAATESYIRSKTGIW